jgi:hypothetical protein
VDNDLGEKFIWQQHHQAHRGHQKEGEEVAQRWVWNLNGDEG